MNSISDINALLEFKELKILNLAHNNLKNLSILRYDNFKKINNVRYDYKF